MLDWPNSVVHDPPRVPIGWRPGAGCLIAAILTPVVFVVTCVALIFALLMWQDDQHHRSVPGDAKPSGFKQLSRWQECGANGEWCADVIIFGANDRSFEDAARDIQTRYREKGWTVTSRPAGMFDDGSLAMSNGDGTTCITLNRFNILKYRRSISAPDASAIAERIEPFTIVIQVSAFECV